MRVHSIYAENYRPFARLEEVRLGPLATIVGQNDVGKSSILRVLQLFFQSRPEIEEMDVHYHADPDENVIAEVAFTSLPQKVELEEGVETTLQDEMLVDPDGRLRIRKTFGRGDRAGLAITLVTHDFEDDRFFGLAALKERELNERCRSVGIDAPKAGRGITNKDKREALRGKARGDGVGLGPRELSLTTKDNLWKSIAHLLPDFVLFETDTRLGVDQTTFQSQFRPVVKAAAEQPDVVEAKDAFTGAIGQALQGEVDKVFERLRRHTDAFVGLTARPEFSWDKAVAFEILGRDQHGVENSLDRRGSGMRRLLMVAFFEYLAERARDNRGDCVFAIEEPENCLHPGLQRELIASFRQLAGQGYQVIVTSHSPVFAAESPIEDLALIVREAGAARAIQTPHLDLLDVAEQLGVEPSDQIIGYNACVFVEGPSDIEFWQTVASKLKDSRRVDATFGDKQIGFVLCGGETLKHWVNRRTMCRLNRRFGVVVDSDRKSPQDNVPGKRENWKRECQSQGGVFFILRKRAMENYLHRDAIARSLRCTPVPYDDFTNMKATFGDKVYKVIKDMSCDDILEMDRYEENGVEHHELLEIAQEFLSLPDSSGHHN